MAYFPIMDQTYLQQSYSEVLYGTNLLGTDTITQYLLAPATNGVVYQSGVIMAIYTAGPNTGKVTNWKEGASNGQGTAIGVLYDQFVDPATSSAPATNASVDVFRTGSSSVYGDMLIIPAGDTLTTALVQLSAVAIQTPSLRTAYNIRGPVVS